MMTTMKTGIQLVFVELWTVPNSNPSVLVKNRFDIISIWNWRISLLWSQWSLVRVVLKGLRCFHWLVWVSGWTDFTDLPLLQSIVCGYDSFYHCHSVTFESKWKEWLIIQICRNSSRLNSSIQPVEGILIPVEQPWRTNPTTTRTPWRWEVMFVLRGVMARSPFLNQLQRKRKQFHMYWFCDSGE